MSDNDPTDYNKPVAYDAQGRPLYAHPPDVTPDTLPFVAPPVTDTHLAMGTSSQGVVSVSDSGANTQDLHVKSKQEYPHLNLTPGEHVIEKIERHPIGIVPIAGASGFVVVAGLLMLLIYPLIERSSPVGTMPGSSTIILPIVMFMALAVLIGYIAYTNYVSNRLYLTDESIIEEVQSSLFARKERTVSLESIEEVTFAQTSIFQTWFNYGTLRIAIEGDHVAYQFPYAANPRDRVKTITNAMEQFKFHRKHGA